MTCVSPVQVCTTKLWSTGRTHKHADALKHKIQVHQSSLDCDNNTHCYPMAVFSLSLRHWLRQYFNKNILLPDDCVSMKLKVAANKPWLSLLFCCVIKIYSICGQRAVSFFVNSPAQHRENEAEPDSNENKMYNYYYTTYLSIVLVYRWLFARWELTPSLSNSTSCCAERRLIPWQQPMLPVSVPS